MKHILSIAIVLLPFFSQAQFLRVEVGPDFFRAEQEGVIYRDRYNHAPEFKSRDLIHDVYWHFGFRTRVFWALNWGTTSFEKFNWGPETGLTINKSSYEMTGGTQEDKEAQYRPSFRFPFLVSLRQGSYSSAYKKKCGYKISAGVEILYSSIRNEAGWFALPVTEISMAIGRVGVGVSLYPVMMKSATIIDGVAYPRLSTRLFSLQLTLSFDHYAERYRVQRARNNN